MYILVLCCLLYRLSQSTVDLLCIPAGCGLQQRCIASATMGSSADTLAGPRQGRWCNAWPCGWARMSMWRVHVPDVPADQGGARRTAWPPPSPAASLAARRHDWGRLESLDSSAGDDGGRVQVRHDSEPQFNHADLLSGKVHTVPLALRQPRLRLRRLRSFATCAYGLATGFPTCWCLCWITLRHDPKFTSEVCCSGHGHGGAVHPVPLAGAGLGPGKLEGGHGPG